MDTRPLPINNNQEWYKILLPWKQALVAKGNKALLMVTNENKNFQGNSSKLDP